ncbi:unnamed protein product, partial [Ectocarpus sp. 12 AP-2014]
TLFSACIHHGGTTAAFPLHGLDGGSSVHLCTSSGISATCGGAEDSRRGRRWLCWDQTEQRGSIVVVGVYRARKLQVRNAYGKQEFGGQGDKGRG